LAEACHRLDQVLDFDGLPPDVRGKVLWSRALLAASLGELARAAAWAHESVDLGRRSGDQVVLGCGLNALAVTQWALGEMEASTRTREQSLAAFSRADHQWGIALCRVLQSRTAIDQAEPGAASLAEAGLAAARASGDLHLVGMGLEQVTRLALREARIDDARDGAAEAVDVQERIGYTEGIIAALHLFGQAALAAADKTAAHAHHARALQLALTIGHAAAMCEALEGLAQVAAARGDCAQAAELLQLADAHRERRSLPRRHDDAEWTRQLRDRVIDVTQTPTATWDGSLEDAVQQVLRLWDGRETSVDVGSGSEA
jgi:hypothetical protein